MDGSGKVRFYKDEAGEWRWRAVANNGEIVADSAEGYTRLDAAINGLNVARSILTIDPLEYVVDEPGEEGSLD